MRVAAGAWRGCLHVHGRDSYPQRGVEPPEVSLVQTSVSSFGPGAAATEESEAQSWNAALGRGIASVDVEASPPGSGRNLNRPPFSFLPPPNLQTSVSSFPGHLWQGDGARFPRAAVPRTGQCTACLKHRQSAEFPAARRRPAPRRPAAGREAPYRGPESVRPIGDRKFPNQNPNRANAVGLWCTYARPDDRGNRPLTLPLASTGSGSEWGGVARHEEAQAN